MVGSMLSPALLMTVPALWRGGQVMSTQVLSALILCMLLEHDALRLRECSTLTCAMAPACYVSMPPGDISQFMRDLDEENQPMYMIRPIVMTKCVTKASMMPRG